MTLLPFFEWCEQSLIGTTVRDSTWIFPVVEAFHLIAFAILGGSVLIVNLRLLGVAFRQVPLAEVAGDARPWFSRSLAVMVVSGVLLFMSESVKCYYSMPFWVKMGALFGGVVFTIVVQQRVTALSEVRIGRFWGKLTAIVSLILWGAVAWGGRWIGFSG